jgi:hypothetical protein
MHGWMDGWMDGRMDDDDDDDRVSTNKGLFSENRRFRLPTTTGLVPLLLNCHLLVRKTRSKNVYILNSQKNIFKKN